jgi:hypothetical protein
MKTADDSVSTISNRPMSRDQLGRVDLELASRIDRDVGADVKAIDSCRCPEQQSAYLVRRTSIGLGQNALNHRS